MAFDKALFRAHPEFVSGPLTAQCVAPGCLLVHAVGQPEPGDNAEDIVPGACLALLEQEMVQHPGMIQPLSPDLLARAEALIGDLAVDLDEDLGDDFAIDAPNAVFRRMLARGEPPGDIEQLLAESKPLQITPRFD